jgi:2-C-methyl-D-erythritol 2,4-cyclodiphosphate synthase
MDSALILAAAAREAAKAGWKVGNLDLVVVAERPKLSPHVPAMRSRIAGILEIDPSQVGIKATTNEGMDAVGQGRALAVHAVCLLFRA